MHSHAERGNETHAERGNETHAEPGSKTHAEPGTKTHAEAGGATYAEPGSAVGGLAVGRPLAGVGVMSGPPADPRLPPVFPFDWAAEWGEDQYGPWVAFRLKGVRQGLRWVPPGRFLMGSPAQEPERWDDEREHWVTLTHGFWLADTACTQALWQAVMGANPSRFQGAERPVETVDWDQVQQFIGQLNAALPGLDAGLPTEAQWEHACRAGTRTPFWFGDQITPEQVNYDGNHPYPGGAKGQYREQTVEVKALPCNAWGLYQMHGNVLEWSRDWYGDYPADAVDDPAGPEAGRRRVARGGSWFNHARNCRSAQRNHWEPANRNDGLGFRLARGP